MTWSARPAQICSAVKGFLPEPLQSCACSSWLHKADMTLQMLGDHTTWGNSQGVLHIWQNPSKLYLKQALSLSRNDCELWYCSAHELLVDQWSMKARQQAGSTQNSLTKWSPPPVCLLLKPVALLFSAVPSLSICAKGKLSFHILHVWWVQCTPEHRERPEQLWCTARFVWSLNLV